MPSFDIISEVDNVEVRNAVENSSRELDTRFDFRGVEASFELNKEIVKISAEHDFQVEQLVHILRGNLAKRGVDANAMDLKKLDHIGKTCFRNVEFKNGIDSATAKKVVKMIKDSKLKVQASIQGEKVRITGKKRDDLQAVMALVRGAEELNTPFQFDNFRD